MIRCWIPFEAVIDHYDGRSDAVNADRIRQHLDSGCNKCSSSVAWMSRVAPALRGAEQMAPVPRLALSRVQALYRDLYKPAVRTPVLARFVFDSRTTPALAMARNAGSTSYQLLYSTDDHDIDIWHEKQSERAWYLIGQILPHSGGHAILPDVASLVSREGKSLVAVPEVSEFHIASVPPGAYELSLRLSDLEITVPDIVIGA